MSGAVVMVVGRVIGTEVRPPEGKRTWEELQIAFAGRSAVSAPVVVTVGDRFEGVIPKDGEFCVIEATPRAYPTKSGGASYAWTGWRRLPEVEAALQAGSGK